MWPLDKKNNNSNYSRNNNTKHNNNFKNNNDNDKIYWKGRSGGFQSKTSKNLPKISDYFVHS